MHAFRALDQDVELDPILEQLTGRPPLDLVYSDETKDELPHLAGGLGMALARTFPILDEDRRRCSHATGQGGTRFDVLLVATRLRKHGMTAGRAFGDWMSASLPDRRSPQCICVRPSSRRTPRTSGRR